MLMILCFFFFNDTATTEIYTLSLHDALPICFMVSTVFSGGASTRNDAPSTAKADRVARLISKGMRCPVDRKSTRLNSSHSQISYAVFCLKKKTNKEQQQHSSQ